jgi:hypothetical protein
LKPSKASKSSEALKPSLDLDGFDVFDGFDDYGIISITLSISIFSANLAKPQLKLGVRTLDL